MANHFTPEKFDVTIIGFFKSDMQDQSRMSMMMKSAQNSL